MKATRRALLGVAVVMALVLCGAAFAEDENSYKTMGLSGVTWTIGTELRGSTTWYYYEWTLYNNTGTPLTDTSGTQYKVLVDTFSIFNTPFGLPDPMDWAAPDGWTLVDKNQFERYDVASSSEKYFVPPSLGPGSSLNGYRFYYNYLPTTSLQGLAYLTHVLAVDPTPVGMEWSDKYNTWQIEYDDIMVNLPGDPGQKTWWDKPGGRPPTAPPLPEAGALLLGMTGLSSLVVLRRLRK